MRRCDTPFDAVVHSVVARSWRRAVRSGNKSSLVALWSRRGKPSAPSPSSVTPSPTITPTTPKRITPIEDESWVAWPSMPKWPGPVRAEAKRPSPTCRRRRNSRRRDDRNRAQRDRNSAKLHRTVRRTPGPSSRRATRRRQATLALAVDDQHEQRLAQDGRLGDSGRQRRNGGRRFRNRIVLVGTNVGRRRRATRTANRHRVDGPGSNRSVAVCQSSVALAAFAVIRPLSRLRNGSTLFLRQPAGSRPHFCNNVAIGNRCRVDPQQEMRIMATKAVRFVRRLPSANELLGEAAGAGARRSLESQHGGRRRAIVSRRAAARSRTPRGRRAFAVAARAGRTGRATRRSLQQQASVPEINATGRFFGPA